MCVVFYYCSQLHLVCTEQWAISHSIAKNNGSCNGGCLVLKSCSLLLWLLTMISENLSPAMAVGHYNTVLTFESIFEEKIVIFSFILDAKLELEKYKQNLNGSLVFHPSLHLNVYFSWQLICLLFSFVYVCPPISCEGGLGLLILSLRGKSIWLLIDAIDWSCELSA